MTPGAVAPAGGSTACFLGGGAVFRCLHSIRIHGIISAGEIQYIPGGWPRSLPLSAARGGRFDDSDRVLLHSVNELLEYAIIPHFLQP